MMKIDALEAEKSEDLCTEVVVDIKEMGVLPISPTTTENDNFEGSFASIFDIFFFKYSYFNL